MARFVARPLSKQFINCTTLSSRSMSSLQSMDFFKQYKQSQEAPAPEVKPFSNVEVFEEYFRVDKLKSLQEARPGAMVSLDKDELAKYFPEGLAGEMRDEFDFSNKAAWMIRDSSKLLCRILDEFVAGKGKSFAETTPAKNMVSTLHVPGVTDRQEWDSATMRVTHLGKDLFSPEKSADGELDITAGEGSPVDKCMRSLGEAAGALPDKILLTGPRGTGKSAVLNQMVLHARRTGWLVLFVARGHDHANGGMYVEPLPTPSAAGAQLFDNTDMTVDVLRGFWRAHAQELKTLPVSDVRGVFGKFLAELAVFEEAWGTAATMAGKGRLSFVEMRAIIEQDTAMDPAQDLLDADLLAGFDFPAKHEQLKAGAPQTLEDLVRFGAAFRGLAGQVFLDLVAELKQVDKYPVLFAADQVNAWEVPASFSVDNKRLHARQLTVPHALDFLGYAPEVKFRHRKKGIPARPPLPASYSLKNGLCVGATSFRHKEGQQATFEDAQSVAKLPLRVSVPQYNQAEYLSAVGHYAHRDVISRAFSEQDLMAFRTHVNSNPHLARETAISFFFPRAVLQDSQRYNIDSILRDVQGEKRVTDARARGDHGSDDGSNSEEEDEDEQSGPAQQRSSGRRK